MTTVQVHVGVTKDEVTPLLEAQKARLAHPGPVLLGPVADSLRATEAGMFMTAGSSAGEAWPMLAESTMRRKGNSAVILVDEGTLRASLTEPGAQYSHVELSADEQTLSFGTDDPVSIFHEHGTVNMPQRNPMPDPWPQQDVDRWVELITDYVLEGKT